MNELKDEVITLKLNVLFIYKISNRIKIFDNI